MTRARLLTQIAAAAILGLAPGLGAAQGTEEAPLIMIPSLTAPIDTAEPRPEIAAEDSRALKEARMNRQRAQQRKPVAAAPDLAPLLSHRAGANPGSIVRLQGENPFATFSIFLPEDAVPGNLRIAHVSGVDVLPERSVMSVRVNGTSVGTAELGKFDTSDGDLFPVPGGVWVAGRNEVEIILQQTHRLFCGPEAAFDLWSDIDLTRSGAVLDQRPLEPGAVDFLAGVAHDAGIGRAIGLRDPSELADSAQPILDTLAMRLTALLRGRILSYENSPAWDVARDHTQEDFTQPARMARITLVPTYGPASATFRRGGDGALVLVIQVPEGGITDDEAAQFLDATFFDVSAEGFAADAEAVQTGIDPRTRMLAGEPVTLESLGMPTTRTVSHYFRRDQIFTLPRDWLVLTAQKAILHLDYAYARNLPEDSIMLIRINGETVRLLPLYGEGGERIEQFPIKFYANLLREGPNLIQFEALIPGDPEDMTCPEIRAPKLEIGGGSTLTVPPSPKLRLNGLRLPVYALRGGSITLNDVPMQDLPAADRLTLVATLGEAQPTATHLTALTLDRLGELPMGHYGFSRSDIGSVLTRPPERSEDTVAPADRIGELPEDLFGPLEPIEGSEVERRSMLSSFVGFSADDLRDQILKIRTKLLPDADVAAETWLDNQRGKAVLTQLDVSDPRHVHLLLGRDTELTEVAASIAAARRTIGGPYGQVAVLGHDDIWRSWADTRRLPVLREPLSFGNIRQVAGNYASWSPAAFTAVLFGLALIMALIGLRLVLITRGDKM